MTKKLSNFALATILFFAPITELESKNSRRENIIKEIKNSAESVRKIIADKQQINEINQKKADQLLAKIQNFSAENSFQELQSRNYALNDMIIELSDASYKNNTKDCPLKPKFNCYAFLILEIIENSRLEQHSTELIEYDEKYFCSCNEPLIQ